MIRTLIADDEPLAREKIRNLLAEEPGFEIVAESGDGRDALDKLRILEPDVMFLDIRMPHLSGFNLLQSKQIVKYPYTIITTAYDTYAIQAFEVGAVDYLLKPFDIERFNAAILKVRRYLDRDTRSGQRMDFAALFKQMTEYAAHDQKQSKSDRVPVKIGRRFRFLSTQSIRYIQADKDYANVHMITGESIHTSDRISHMALKLPQDRFLRIHRSIIVNMERLKEVRRMNHDYGLIMDNDEQFISGYTYKKTIQSMLVYWKEKYS